MINPHISDIMLPTLWPSQSYNNEYHHIIALQIGLRRVLMLALATEKTTKISPKKKKKKKKPTKYSTDHKDSTRRVFYSPGICAWECQVQKIVFVLNEVEVRF